MKFYTSDHFPSKSEHSLGYFVALFNSHPTTPTPLHTCYLKYYFLEMFLMFHVGLDSTSDNQI